MSRVPLPRPVMLKGEAHYPHKSDVIAAWAMGIGFSETCEITANWIRAFTAAVLQTQEELHARRHASKQKRPPEKWGEVKSFQKCTIQHSCHDDADVSGVAPRQREREQLRKSSQVTFLRPAQTQGHCARSEGAFQTKACVLSLSQEVRKAPNALWTNREDGTDNGGATR